MINGLNKTYRKERMTPSKYQKAINEAFIETNDNLCIEAGPGAGKSTVLVELSKHIPRYKKAIFLAFNKSIVDELKTKLPSHVDCSTLHSYGYRILYNRFGNTLKLDQYKTLKLSKSVLESLKMPRKKDIAYKLTIQSILDFYRITGKSFTEVVKDYDIICKNGELKHTPQVWNELIKYNSGRHNKMMIDFVDMLYLPLSLNIAFFQYDIILIDEVQDFSFIQHQLLSKIMKPNGRIIGVGDGYQCQPTGTKILMTSGEEKNIEDIVVGDVVVSASTYRNGGRDGYSKYVGFKVRDMYAPKVLNIQSRYNEEDLIVIKSNNKISKYTKNHRCMIRYNAKNDGFCVYLMRKNDIFRIGISPLWNNNYKAFGPKQRMLQEKADELWILKVFKTKKESYLAEQYLSCLYSIPQMIFNLSQKRSTLIQQDIDLFYSQFLKDELHNRAIKLLKDYSLDINLSLFNNKIKYARFSTKGLSEIKAINIPILHEYLQVAHFDENHKTKYKSIKYDKVPFYYEIDEVWREKYKGLVYSLKIDKELYVADGMLTHNSIYSFAGASSNSVDLFKEKFKTTNLPLSISYRLPKTGVTNVHNINDKLEYHNDAIEGIVRVGTIEEIQEGDFVICRNTKPLVTLYFELLKQEKKATIMGRDMEKGLLKIINTLEIENMSEKEAIFVLNQEKQYIYDILKGEGIENPLTHYKYINFDEKADIIQLFLEKYKSTTLVKQKLHEVFDENRPGVKLMTGHRSKGLESDIVFFITHYEDKKLIPSKYALSEEQLLQERNLEYVIKTRHKKKLIYIKL